MTSKLLSERPRTSRRVLDDQSSENSESSSRRSRIPRPPKRTFSLEGNESTHSSSRLSTNHYQTSFSMIPRLDRKKPYKKPTALNYLPVRQTKLESQTTSPESAKKSMLRNKIHEEFIAFKNNVLKIPEFWADAGQTVTKILKNAVNIVSKQYPSADVEAFEFEIENILRATEAVKDQILKKTESIIFQANEIYLNTNDVGQPKEEEVQKIKKKMEDLKSEVELRKNIFGDLLKCSSEMKHLVDLEKALKDKVTLIQRENNSDKGIKKVESKKSKVRMSCSPVRRQWAKSTLQSCGDMLRPSTASCSGGGRNASTNSFEHKSSQTINLTTADLHKRYEDLTIFNNEVLELHQLCKDHITKFKSFNLQIKLRGICSKAQGLSTSKELQLLNDENRKLQHYNKDLEAALKQKEFDINQKDRLICQQKKLLHVRDELISMLKNKCQIQEMEHL